MFKYVLSGKNDIIFLLSIPGSRPLIKISPDVGCNKSLIIFIIVVFPLPLGPSNP